MAPDFIHLSNLSTNVRFLLTLNFSPSRSGRDFKKLKRSIGGWKVDKTSVQCQKISEIKK